MFEVISIDIDACVGYEGTYTTMTPQSFHYLRRALELIMRPCFCSLCGCLCVFVLFALVC